jgi:hypothetical protein
MGYRFYQQDAPTGLSTTFLCKNEFFRQRFLSRTLPFANVATNGIPPFLKTHARFLLKMPNREVLNNIGVHLWHVREPEPVVCSPARRKTANEKARQ